MSGRRFSIDYMDELLSRADASARIELASIISSWSGYDRSLPFCGVTPALLAYVEVVAWEAQSWRSGAWTYYEATPERIQRDVMGALERDAPADLSEIYARGMREWRGASVAASVDAWLKENEASVHNWLKTLAERHRLDILEVS
jgi:hypothetical protein